MRKLVAGTVLMCLFCCVSAFAQDKSVAEKELLGSWTYTMDNPMSGIMKGVCTIEKQESGVIAIMKGEGDSGEGIITTPLVKNEDGLFYASLTSQGYDIDISFELEGGKKMKCEMYSDLFSLPFEMVKK